MENLYLFLVAAITAMAVENAIFARGLGLSRKTMFMNSPKAGILFGGVLTWMVTVSSLFVSLTNYLLAGNAYIMVLRPLCYLLGILAVYVGTSYGADKVLPPALATGVHDAMPVSTFNSALFGAFYISAFQNFGFFQTTGYALGSGIGYTAAILMIYFARKRLAISPVPRAFRGLPILLVYLGLISLAIYGLIGHGLPT